MRHIKRAIGPAREIGPSIAVSKCSREIEPDKHVGPILGALCQPSHDLTPRPAMAGTDEFGRCGAARDGERNAAMTLTLRP